MLKFKKSRIFSKSLQRYIICFQIPVLIVFSVLPILAIANEIPVCSSSFAPEKNNLSIQEKYTQLVDKDLFDIQKSYIELDDPNRIEKHNENELQKLTEYGNDISVFHDGNSDSRLRTSISKMAASALLHLIQNHPVVSLYVVDQYDPDGDIGFCYGRATFADLALRTAGVSPTAIKKLWAIGKMQNSWRYHTTTIVRVEGGQWLAIDPLTDWSNGRPEVPSRPATAAEWIAVGKLTGRDKNLMYFVTDSQKLTPKPGRYSRHSLSLENRNSSLKREDYFFDMINWLKKPESKNEIQLAISIK